MLNGSKVSRRFSISSSRRDIYPNILVGFSFLALTFLTVKTFAPDISSNADTNTAIAGSSSYSASISTSDATSISINPTDTQTIFTGQNSITYTNQCPHGFTVSLSSSSDNPSLIRAGNDSATKTIPTISSGNALTDNTWGYSLDNGETYNGVPGISSPATIINTTSSNTDPVSLNLTYGVKTNNEIPAGKYSNDIIYTVAVKPQCLVYDLKWDLNGGTGASGVSYDDSEITYGSTMNLQNYTPTRTGYTFTGWKSSVTGNTFATDSGTIDINPTNAMEVTLTAQWTPVNYTISYTLNGGSATNPTSYNIETNTITLNNPTRTGYTFAGWTGSNGSTAQTTVTIPKGSTGTKLFVANWSVNKYTVTYEDWFVDASNNRKVKLGSATKSVNYGTSVSGTELGTDTSNSKYYSNYSYRSATSGTVPANNNLVVYRYFYAWTDLNIYYAGGGTQGGATVSLSTNGSNWTDVTNESNTIQPYGTTYYIKNIRPVHSYEEFDRVENLSYNSSAGYYTYTPTAAGTSMSIWMKYKTYSISYNLNGGSASNPTSYNYTSSFTLNNPTRSGYNFTGWSGTGLSGSANKSVTISGSTGNRSYTANWQGVGILSISNMQDMTSALCSASATGTTTTLKDTRDNNTYTVAKLKDGHCWMTQNLRLINKTITPSDSNVSSNFVIPNSNFTENDEQGSHGALAYVWQTGNTSYGVYYNYYAATGGTIVGSVRDEAVYDICPKGWKMPSKAQQDALLTSYGVANNATGSATMRSAPLNFVYSGYINYNSSGALAKGSEGLWWSTTAYSSSFRQGIKIAADTAVIDGQYRFNGASIRCIAK